MSPPDREDGLRGAFRDLFGRWPDGVLFSPGRVNLIGEHIDYCGGLVLPMAISRGTRLAFAPNDTGRLRVYSARFAELAEFVPADRPEACGHWSDYVAGVARQLGEVGGVDIYVADDIACGGLSSSASFCVGIALALSAIAGRPVAGDRARLDMAQLCRRAENEFVGVPCGIMDHASVALGGVIKLDCASLAFQRLDADFGEYCVAVMDTGKPRSLAASKYSERVGEIGKICAVLGDGCRPESLCRDVPMAEMEERCAKLSPTLQRRLRHVVGEQARVEEAFATLLARDFSTFGRLMTGSHVSLRDNYEVTGPELDAIVAASLAQPGVLGARMTGAGFGGCAVALVARDAAAEHARQVASHYHAATGLEANVFSV